MLKITHYTSYASVVFVLFNTQYFNIWAFALGILLITMMGSSAGLHRYFGHKCFKTSKFGHWFLGLVTTLSSQGSIAWWVDIHRVHHEYTDGPGDPIAPVNLGFWKSFFCLQDESTAFGQIRPRAVVKELRDPAVKFFHNWYWHTIILYNVLLGLIDPILILNMYLLPVFMIRFNFGVQNTFGHGWPTLGYRNHDTEDNSRNSTLVNVLTCFLGEALHNNHHYNPSKYYYRERWFELDPTGWIIKHVFAQK